MGMILVVDDEQSSRMILTRFLEQEGHTVIVTGDGQQALDLLLLNPTLFDVIVTDYQMPNLNGRELIKAIRGYDYFDNLPVLIVSGVVGMREISDLLQQGASAFLAKPVGIRALRRELPTLLRQRQPAQAEQSA